jgi:hypothetical protein
VAAILLSLLLAAAAGAPASSPPPVSEVVVPGHARIFENAAAGLDSKPILPNGMDVICWDEKPAGSHIVKRICATRGEIERLQEMSKQAVSDRPRPPPSAK